MMNRSFKVASEESNRCEAHLDSITLSQIDLWLLILITWKDLLHRWCERRDDLTDGPSVF